MPKAPKGTVERTGIKQAVKFESSVFERIKARAIKLDKSFSDVVNDLCRCGLLDIEESEADEPPQLQVINGVQ